jgi:hypothetical protein
MARHGMVWLGFVWRGKARIKDNLKGVLMDKELIEKLEQLLAEIEKSIIETGSGAPEKYTLLHYQSKISSTTSKINGLIMAGKTARDIKPLLRKLAELAIEAEVLL